MLYYTSFQGSTMLTGPGVLQWKKIILEPSVFIPRGGHSRTFQLEGIQLLVHWVARSFHENIRRSMKKITGIQICDSLESEQFDHVWSVKTSQFHPVPFIAPFAWWWWSSWRWVVHGPIATWSPGAPGGGFLSLRSLRLSRSSSGPSSCCYRSHSSGWAIMSMWQQGESLESVYIRIPSYTPLSL